MNTHRPNHAWTVRLAESVYVHRAHVVITTALLALVAIGCIACATAQGAVTTDRECFPADSWSPAPDSVRPCVTIKANAPEAGAVRYTVADGSGIVRYAGYINTPYRQIIHVRIVRVAEDGSFTWKARSRDGRTTTASVGNLED